MDGSSNAKMSFEYNPEGRRDVGRPRKRLALSEQAKGLNLEMIMMITRLLCAAETYTNNSLSHATIGFSRTLLHDTPIQLTTKRQACERQRS